MKKTICIFGVVCFLLVSSVTAFADPVGRPDTEDALRTSQPISITCVYGGK